MIKINLSSILSRENKMILAAYHRNTKFQFSMILSYFVFKCYNFHINMEKVYK